MGDFSTIRCIRIGVAAAAGVTVLAFASIVAAQVSFSPESSETEEYWTPDRLENAIPRDNLVTPPSARDIEEGTAELEGERPSAKGPSSPPLIDVEPDLEDRLYDVEDDDLEVDSSSSFEGDSFLGETAFSPLGAIFSHARVFPSALLDFPHRTIGKLFFTDPITQLNFICSAFVIQQRIVATAGHCTFDPVNDTEFTNFLFVPAFDRGTAPFRAWRVQRVIVANAWASGDGVTLPNAEDFALLEIKDRRIGGVRRKIGEVTGWLGWRTNAAAPNHVAQHGYPVNLDGGLRLQVSHAQTFRTLAPNAAEFGSGHGRGGSGGPFTENFGPIAVGGLRVEDANRVVGIQSYSYFDLDTGDFLQVSGTSILNDEFARIFQVACRWRRGNCGS